MQWSDFSPFFFFKEKCSFFSTWFLLNLEISGHFGGYSWHFPNYKDPQCDPSSPPRWEGVFHSNTQLKPPSSKYEFKAFFKKERESVFALRDFMQPQGERLECWEGNWDRAWKKKHMNWSVAFQSRGHFHVSLQH